MLAIHAWLLCKHCECVIVVLEPVSSWFTYNLTVSNSASVVPVFRAKYCCHLAQYCVHRVWNIKLPHNPLYNVWIALHYLLSCAEYSARESKISLASLLIVAAHFGIVVHQVNRLVAENSRQYFLQFLLFCNYVRLYNMSLWWHASPKPSLQGG